MIECLHAQAFESFMLGSIQMIVDEICFPW